MTDEPVKYRLHVDQKWSIEYDPADNDRPISIWRNGVLHDADPWLNSHAAIFHALKETRNELAKLRFDTDQTTPVPQEHLDALADRVSRSIDKAMWQFMSANLRDMPLGRAEAFSVHIQSAAERAIKREDPEA